MGQKYNENHLNALKSCFYEQLKDDDEKLNIGLNVFFNNDPNNSDNWKTSFKQRIIQLREERLESEKVTIERKEISTKNLENIDPKKIIDAGREKWMSIKNSLDNFLIKLKEKLGSNKLEQSVIYEAPPYKITYSIENEETEFIGSFIFEETCPSAYAQSIKDWADGSKANPADILADKKTGFFDIIPIPLPINFELRTLWATHDDFLINGKRIFIYFFEWAVEDYIKRLNDSNIKVSDDHKVAIGVPLNNAVTLYEYYELNKPKIDLLKYLLTPNNFEKKNTNCTGLWLQHYKSSIISPGNKPIAKLIENAFS